jgi:hypothetical protein
VIALQTYFYIAIMMFIYLAFIGAKLGNIVQGTWFQVTSPMWIAYTGSLVFPVIYYSQRGRCSSVAYAIRAVCFVIVLWLLIVGPFFTFHVLLSVKMDSIRNVDYSQAFTPLFVSTISYCEGLLLSCGWQFC